MTERGTNPTPTQTHTTRRGTTSVTTTTLLDAALALHDAGLCVVPARPDGTKAPAAFWKKYQAQRPSREQIHAWFSTDQYDGLGVITGAVSGSLEMFELEGRATEAGIGAGIADIADNSDLGDLWRTVTSGYFEVTPSGGFHLLYRVDGTVAGSTKLARRPATDRELAENPDEKIKVLIETRGEGGFTVCAPSGGRTHPSGGAWVMVSGTPTTIPTISEDERDAIHVLAATADTMPKTPTLPPAQPRAAHDPQDGLRPGDDYNDRARWADILPDWRQVYTDHSGITYWRRPGKRIGLSATTGLNDGNNLYVFTTSTSFEAETPYSKFGAYTHLHHNGDWKAAAKALAADGYGTAKTEPVITITNQIFTPPPGDAHNLATVHQLNPQPDPHPATTTLERSDDGNALALIARYGDRVRYCPDRGRWLAWDGQRWHWQTGGGGGIRELAKTVARDLPDDDQPAITHKRKSLSAVGITNMLTQAATDPRITVDIDDLDANPWELNTPGGVINLRTGQIHPARPDQLHTRITRCAPADSTDTTWVDFLADTFGADTALVSYLQRLVGYSAIGTVGAHVLPFCHGSGGNGKGVFLEACAGVLGDYATTAPVGFLMGRGFTGHETEIARLAGARMVICSEVNEDDMFDEAKVKQLTGGDTLTARFMRQDHFTFTPSHQLWLMGNTQPSVRTGGRSFWRRVRLVPFTREVPEKAIVDDLQGILTKDHGPAILAWITAGAVAYANGGLDNPATVITATADYAHDQDTVARFLDDQCLLGGGQHVKAKVTIVREAYETWCRTEGEEPVSARSLTQTLARKGVDSTKGGKGIRHYTGISLLSNDDEEGGRSW